MIISSLVRYFKIPGILALIGSCLPPLMAQTNVPTAAERKGNDVPLSVENGRLLRHGKPYRAIGVNYFDAFYRTLKDGSVTNYDQGFRILAENEIPFVRLCGGGYWAGDMKLYLTNRADYFRRFDGVVRSAEKHGIGLIPSFFWFTACVPDLTGEPCDQWGNPKSRTHAFMRDYVRDVVTRYRNSQAFWAWEFGNEFNLRANLPNAREHRPAVVPTLGTPSQRTERDELTYEIIRTAFTEFAREVRKHDPRRILLTGDSILRESAWHHWKENNWNKDTPEQFASMLAMVTPEAFDAVSIHVYEDALLRLTNVLAAAKAMGKPVFIGEFGAQGPPERSEEKFRLMLTQIETNDVPLAALWVFDYKPQDKEYNVTISNARGFQLRAIAEANRRLRVAQSSKP